MLAEAAVTSGLKARMGEDHIQDHSCGCGLAPGSHWAHKSLARRAFPGRLRIQHGSREMTREGEQEESHNLFET